MFVVLRCGVPHSTHDSYASACRVARIQANQDQGAYFTVQRRGQREVLYKAEAANSSSTYLVKPLIPRMMGIDA